MRYVLSWYNMYHFIAPWSRVRSWVPLEWTKTCHFYDLTWLRLPDTITKWRACLLDPGGGLRRSACVLRLAGLLLTSVVLTSPSLATAQTGTPRRTVWDGVYTEAQATRGTMGFGQRCSGGHALASVGKAPLVGEPFWKSFAQKTVGDLLEFVSANMPNGSPRSLSD